MSDPVPCTPAAAAVAPARERIVCSMPRAELIRLCQVYGPHLQLADCIAPDGCQLDGVRLLFALSGRESSFGANMRPRFEKAYYVDGEYWQRSIALKQFIVRWGREGACSYGPLQVLACNVIGFTPLELGADPERALQASVSMLNRYVLTHWKARTLPQMCQVWNGGHLGATTTPGYVDTVAKYYAGCEAELKWSAHVDLGSCPSHNQELLP